MVKWILTHKCLRACPYCIMQNVPHTTPNENLKDVANSLQDIRFMDKEQQPLLKPSSVMLTGGEPMIAPHLYEKVLLAHALFDEVYISTGDTNALTENYSIWKYIDAVTYSLHDHKALSVIEEYGMRHPVVYAAIVYPQLWEPDLPKRLFKAGFKGLTINEDHRGTAVWDISAQSTPDFSWRINRRGRCLTKTYMLMPNLDIIDDFEEYV